MKLRDVAIRFRSRPLVPMVGVTLDQQLACLGALRRELTASYPSILSDRLLRIARKYGMDRFPEGFLVSGGIADSGPAGARAHLRQIRRNQPGSDGTFHPLFSSEFYRLRYADVAAAGTPPWVHYQVFGRAENRTPHPLIDISYLSAWFPATSRGAILDEYLMSPRSWTADPSPYVDCQKFLLHGGWDGTTHPLVQIVGKRLTAPWIHQRLLLIDANSGEPDAARTTAIGYLLSRSTARSRLASVETWSAAPNPAPTLPGTVMVVPGFFVGSAGRVITAPSGAMVSPDTTVIALPTEFLSIRSGVTIVAPRLRFIDRALDFTDLQSLVRTTPRGTAIAPFTKIQAATLREILHREGRSDLVVLDYGVQARVTADVLSVVEQTTASGPVPDWNGDSTSPTDLAFVLSSEEAGVITSDARISAAVRAGAAACILGSDSVSGWTPVLLGRCTIVCTSSTVTDVLAVIERDRVFRLDTRRDATA